MKHDKRAGLRARLQNEIILLDGALGTMLQASGLPLGEYPERLSLTKPGEISALHRSYALSGADILYTNTFGANARKLPPDLNPEAVVEAGVKLAADIAHPLGKLVGLDVGPVGELMEPMGGLTFEEAYALFAQVMVCGERAGADLIALETMTDLAEVRAALLAARENTGLPVLATMTFEETGRTFTGCDLASFAITAGGLGADAIGINCSLGPRQILPLIREMAGWTDLPLIVKANAGLPLPDGGGYSVDVGEFAEVCAEFLELGVSVLGGCCGTAPAYIEALDALRAGRKRVPRPPVLRPAVCSAARVVELDGVRVVGERLNPTGKKEMKAALLKGDMDYVAAQAIAQTEAGAEILDVNVGLPGLDEREAMLRVIRTLSSVCGAPLQIDSSQPEVLEAALRVYPGKAVVNSVNGDDESLEAVLPIVKNYGAAVIGLTLDKRGIPKDCAARVEIAEKIARRAAALGIPKENLILDCLTLTVSAEQGQVFETLDALREVKRRGYLTTLGVSNVSFGLPRRELVNAAFLLTALGAGLDLPIVNPNVSANMDAVRAFRTLSGQDKNCGEFTAFYANTLPPPPPAPQKSGHTAETGGTAPRTVGYAILKGLAEAGPLTRELLRDRDPLEVVNEFLIPALDEVGRQYERGTIFLPQLIQSAETAKLGFDEVRRALAGKASSDKGTVVLATVRGDIHDIGKNIVKVVLENYGYRIVDLGKNVEIQTVVEAVRRENAKLVGLSALMTTTVLSMKETIEALRAAGLDCKVMVGGAVLTEEYAESIGADFYAKDANQSVKIARQVLG